MSKPWRCPTCEKGFKSRRAVEDHQRDAHEVLLPVPRPPKRQKSRLRAREIDQRYLDGRTAGLAARGWGKTKWIEFCEAVLRQGFRVRLYEAKTTVSKYIFVERDNSPKSFKVRFSNHRPNAGKQERGDCDFFVGVSNGLVTTTNDALVAVDQHFREELITCS